MEEEEGRRRRKGGRRRGGAKIVSAYIREQIVEMWEGTRYNFLIATCPNQTSIPIPLPSTLNLPLFLPPKLGHAGFPQAY